MTAEILTVILSALTGGLLTAPLTAWLSLRKGNSEIRRSERSDALSEWMKISSDRATEILRLDTDVKQLRDEHQDCLIKQAKTDGELESLRRQINVLTLDRHEENTEYVWVIATMDGIIRDAGGRVPQMLHRRPKDLVLKPIDILLPPNDVELSKAHHEGMARVALTGLVRPKALLGKAITAEGAIINVMVSLAATEWRGDPAIRAQIFEIDAEVSTNN